VNNLCGILTESEAFLSCHLRQEVKSTLFAAVYIDRADSHPDLCRGGAGLVDHAYSSIYRPVG
jgi:hypothetical protein